MDDPHRIINNLVCLLTGKSHDVSRRNVYFENGSKNKDGNTFLPLDPIVYFECACPDNHNFTVICEVKDTFYAILTN